MGDEILMKKLIILPLLAIYLEANDSRLAMVSEYQSMFSKIGEKRVGVDHRTIDSVKTPFVQVKKVNGEVVKKQASPFVLQAIVNRRAKIDGKWYSLSDDIGDLKVVSIKMVWYG